MDRLHITQDDDGYWMLSHESSDGTLRLLAHHFPTPDHLIENAREMVAQGRVQATLHIDPPRPAEEALRSEAPDDKEKPSPRKARL